MDKLRALEVFACVAREGSLVGAARKLSLSAPSVTRIVNELEEELGNPLLLRSTRAISLTETGTAYLKEAERILEDMRAADAMARGHGVQPRGTLKLTCSVLFGQYYVTPLIGEFLSRFPDVRVDATFLDRNVNLIEEGFDVAVRIGELRDSNLRAIRVGTVRQVVCASPGYLAQHGIPMHPEELQNHTIIHFRSAGFHDESWRFDGGLKVRIDPRMTFSTIAPCLIMAQAGHGLTRVLSYQISSEAEAQNLVTVLDDYSSKEWPVHLVHAAAHGQSAKLRTFLDLATDRLRANRFLNAS